MLKKYTLSNDAQAAVHYYDAIEVYVKNTIHDEQVEQNKLITDIDKRLVAVETVINSNKSNRAENKANISLVFTGVAVIITLIKLFFSTKPWK